MAGPSGLGPQLRDVRLAYGTGHLPDRVVITSVPMSGEVPRTTCCPGR
ncbi:hypothetical protein [Saccharopolyspora aridisoli]|nr:hypothetical protein [Saccharopolyspora aridisoli]